METENTDTAVAVIEQQAIALVQGPVSELTKLDDGLTELAKRYAGVAYDLTTTKGDTEARQAREAIRQVRYNAHNIRKETVSMVHNAMQGAKDQVNSLADSIIERVKAVEEPIDQQIKADEQRRAYEKAERDRIAAEAAKKVQASIDGIREYLVRAAGATGQKIADMGRELEALDISIEHYGERTGEALQLRNEVAAKLAAMSAAEAERLMRQAELDRQQQELNEQRAAFAAEQESARKAQAERDAAEQAERQRKARIQQELDRMHTHYGNIPMGTSSERIVSLMEKLGGMQIRAEHYGERVLEAEGIKAGLLQGLEIALGHAKEAEAKAQAEAAERARVEAEQRAEHERLAKVAAAADDLLGACRRSVSFLADLNGADWIKGDDHAAIDMRQRSKSLQTHVFKALTKAGDYQ